jgi:hypothetical protein
MRRALSKLTKSKRVGGGRRKSSVSYASQRKQSTTANTSTKRSSVSAPSRAQQAQPDEDNNEIDSDDGDFHNIWSGEAPDFSANDLQDMVQGRYVPDQEPSQDSHPPTHPNEYEAGDEVHNEYVETGSAGSYMENSGEESARGNLNFNNEEIEQDAHFDGEANHPPPSWEVDDDNGVEDEDEEYEMGEGGEMHTPSELLPLNERMDLHASLLQSSTPTNNPFVGDSHYQVSDYMRVRSSAMSDHTYQCRSHAMILLWCSLK